jgi:hypothetical protein
MTKFIDALFSEDHLFLFVTTTDRNFIQRENITHISYSNDTITITTDTDGGQYLIPSSHIKSSFLNLENDTLRLFIDGDQARRFFETGKIISF